MGVATGLAFRATERMGCQDPKEVTMQKQNAQSPRDKTGATEGLRKKKAS